VILGWFSNKKEEAKIGFVWNDLFSVVTLR
jgi:hypothetical protein